MTIAPDDRITYIGRTDHRNAGVLFGIRERDRRSHLYVVGKTGTGKSHLLKLMMAQDVRNGVGFALFDPHGDLARETRSLAEEVRKDVVYVDVADAEQPWRFNPFAHVPSTHRALAAAGIVETFKKLWTDDWGPRLEHLLRNVVFTLLETPDASFADVPALLADKEYRRGITSRLDDPVVQDFWQNEFEKYAPGFKSVVIAPLQNKIGALLTDPVSRRILTEAGTLLDLKQIMDEGKVLIVNLDKGRIGEAPSALLGSLLLSHIALTGLHRSEKPEAERRDFFVYLDEFQTFTTLSIATMLSELRKYRVGLVLSHQHLSQLDPAVRDAVFGNAGTIISFRVGAADAHYLAREFAPIFTANDLIALPRYHVYLKLLIDGATSEAFSAVVPEIIDLRDMSKMVL